MGDTYDDVGEADADRDQQRALHSALGLWDRALQRDDTRGPSSASATPSTRGEANQHLGALRRLPFSPSLDGNEGTAQLLRTEPRWRARRLLTSVCNSRRAGYSEAEGSLRWSTARLRSFAFARTPRSEPALEQNIGLGGRRHLMPIRTTRRPF